jgi:hypothetical protein
VRGRALLFQRCLEKPRSRCSFAAHISMFLHRATFCWRTFEHVGLLVDKTPYFGAWSTLWHNELRDNALPVTSEGYQFKLLHSQPTNQNKRKKKKDKEDHLYIKEQARDAKNRRMS